MENIVTKIKILVSSKAFWSVAGIFVYQGLQAIVPVLGQGHFGQVVQVLLAVLAIYQHPTEVMNVGRTGFLGSTKVPEY